ncbi:MAG: glucose PTS transporter subunit IIA [Thomasclavelia sp.]
MNLEERVSLIFENVGGKENIISVTHCATRLRLELIDVNKVDKTKVENIEGVIGMNIVNKQCQIIIGGDVVKYYPYVLKFLDGQDAMEVKEKEAFTLKGIGNAILEYISGTMTPLISPLIGCAMIRGLILLLEYFKLLDTASSTYCILYAISNSVFYFMPILVAISAAKKLKVNPFIAACIAGALMEPTFTGLMKNTGDIVDFIGIPVYLCNYTSQVLPALISTWLYSYLYRFLEKRVPGSVSTVVIPTFCLIIFAPLTSIIFGPLAYFFGQFIGWAFNSLWTISPIIAGIFAGVTFEYAVVTGMHWVLVALCLNDFALYGYSQMYAIWAAAAFSVHAITLGALWIAKTKKEKNDAISCLIALFVGGVVEPSLYNYLVKDKRYALPMAISGGLTGGICGMFGIQVYAFGLPNIMALPTFKLAGSWVYAAFVFVIEWIIGAVLVKFMLGRSKKMAIDSPVNGKIKKIEDMQDPVFASKTLGNGIAIIPSDNKIYSPIDGEVVSLYPTKHAIGLRNKEGLEILIHIGIDTVELKGEGFDVYVTQGDKIKKGQLLMKFDLEGLRKKGYDMTIPVIFVDKENDIELVDENQARANRKLLYIDM